MCPKCGADLIVLELDGVEIDHCPECRGTWLDAGELELLCEMDGIQPGSVQEALYDTRAERKTQRRCPRCRRRMEGIALSGIELERCRYSHGLWFDQGEMRALIQAFASESGEQGRVARFFADLYRNELNDAPVGG